MSTAVAINVAVGLSATDLYVAGASIAQLTSLMLHNTTGGDIDVDVWKRDAGNTTSWVLATTQTVKAGRSKVLGKVLLTFENSGEKLRAQASATGVDAIGSIIEY